jgi:neurotransmitter:Na+ symporter, NSS family
MSVAKNSFSSNLGYSSIITFVLLGLNSFWVFPYFVLIHDESAFIFFYFIFLILIVFPVIVGGLIIGKHIQKTSSGTTQQHFIETLRWKSLRILVLLTIFFILFYQLIMGRLALFYLTNALNGFFQYGRNPAFVKSLFGNFANSPSTQIIYQFLFLIIILFSLKRIQKVGLSSFFSVSIFIFFCVLVGLFIESYSLVGFENPTTIYKNNFNRIFSYNESGFSIFTFFRYFSHCLLTFPFGLGLVLLSRSIITNKVSIIRTTALISIQTGIILIMIASIMISACEKSCGKVRLSHLYIFKEYPNIFVKLENGIIFQILFYFLVFLVTFLFFLIIYKFFVECFAISNNKSRDIVAKFALLLIFLFGVYDSYDSVIFRKIEFNWLFGQRVGLSELIIDLTFRILIPLCGILFSIYLAHQFDSILKRYEGSEIKRLFVTMFVYHLKYVVPFFVGMTLLFRIVYDDKNLVLLFE